MLSCSSSARAHLNECTHARIRTYRVYTHNRVYLHLYVAFEQAKALECHAGVLPSKEKQGHTTRVLNLAITNTWSGESGLPATVYSKSRYFRRRTVINKMYDRTGSQSGSVAFICAAVTRKYPSSWTVI